MFENSLDQQKIIKISPAFQLKLPLGLIIHIHPVFDVKLKRFINIFLVCILQIIDRHDSFVNAIQLNVKYFYCVAVVAVQLFLVDYVAVEN
jgi:hypothetical protein